MSITVFETLSDLSVFIKNCKNFECFNCVGRQGSEKNDEKTIITEIVLYSNVGILYHSSKNRFKTDSNMSPIARKETILLDDKAELFNSIAEKYHIIKNSVKINSKGQVEIGYLTKIQSTAETLRTLA